MHYQNSKLFFFSKVYEWPQVDSRLGANLLYLKNYHSTSDFVFSFDTYLSAAPLWLCILEYSQGSQTRFLPDEDEIYTPFGVNWRHNFSGQNGHLI